MVCGLESGDVLKVIFHNLFQQKKHTPTDKLGTVSYMHLASFCWSNVTCILQDPPLLYLAHFGGIPILVLPEDMLPTQSGPLK